MSRTLFELSVEGVGVWVGASFWEKERDGWGDWGLGLLLLFLFRPLSTCRSFSFCVRSLFWFHTGHMVSVGI